MGRRADPPEVKKRKAAEKAAREKAKRAETRQAARAADAQAGHVEPPLVREEVFHPIAPAPSLSPSACPHPTTPKRGRGRPKKGVANAQTTDAPGGPSTSSNGLRPSPNAAPRAAPGPRRLLAQPDPSSRDSPIEGDNIVVSPRKTVADAAQGREVKARGSSNGKNALRPPLAVAKSSRPDPNTLTASSLRRLPASAIATGQRRVASTETSQTATVPLWQESHYTPPLHPRPPTATPPLPPIQQATPLAAAHQAHRGSGRGTSQSVRSVTHDEPRASSPQTRPPSPSDQLLVEACREQSNAHDSAGPSVVDEGEGRPATTAEEATGAGADGLLYETDDVVLDSDEETDDEYNPDPADESASEEDEEIRLETTPPITSSPFVRERIVEGMRLTGCDCPCFSNANCRSHEQQQDGLAIHDMLSTWIEECHLPNVLEGVAKERKIPRVSERLWRATRWETLLGRGSGDDGQALRLSLESSCLLAQGADVQLRRRWDVDGWFIPLRSLGAAKSGIWHYPFPSPSRTMQTWRMRLSQYYIDNMKCAHLYLGRTSEGEIKYDIYVFFPRLPAAPVKTKRGLSLTSEQKSHWSDKIFYPAVQDVYPTFDRQYHPWDWNSASDRAKARQRENLKKGNRTVTELGYYLENKAGKGRRPPLELLWQQIEARARRQPDVAWRTLQLAAVAYGTKQQVHSSYVSNQARNAVELEQNSNASSTSAFSLQTRIEQTLETAFNTTLIERPYTWVDFAYDDSAVYYTPNGERVPVVLLRKTCCNGHDAARFAAGAQRRTFYWQGTADASSVTVQPGVRSAAYQGGAAYMQAYNVVRELTSSLARSSGGLLADDALKFIAFTQPSLDTFADQIGRRSDSKRRQRFLKVMVASLMRLHHALEANSSSHAPGFAARQEWRTVIDTIGSLVMPEDHQPSLVSGRHWPYFAIPLQKVLDYIREDTNRWLFAICSVLTPPRPTLDAQHLTCASVSAFLDVLSLSVNGQQLSRHLRHSHHSYDIAGGGGEAGAAPEAQDANALATTDAVSSQDPTVRAEDAPVAIGCCRTHGESGLLGGRRGLGLLCSLEERGFPTLPSDLMDWQELHFRRQELQKTAYFDSLFQRDVVRHGNFLTNQAFLDFVEKQLQSLPEPSEGRQWVTVCRHLWSVCIFLYCNHILTAIRKSGHFAGTDNKRITAADWAGVSGLNFRLLMRATDRDAYITYCRGLTPRQVDAHRAEHEPKFDGAGAKIYPRRKGGAKAFPNDWTTKIQLLFDFDSGYDHGNWESAGFRKAFRHCYQSLRDHPRAGLRRAEQWRRGIGDWGAQGRITVMPQFEKNKLWHVEPMSEGGPAVRWWAARPDVPERGASPRDSSTESSLLSSSDDGRPAARTQPKYLPAFPDPGSIPGPPRRPKVLQDDPERAWHVTWTALKYVQPSKQQWLSASIPRDDLDDLLEDDPTLMGGLKLKGIEDVTAAYLARPQ